MPTVLVNVYEARNISNQGYAINVQDMPSSTIFTQSGPIFLQPQAVVVAETVRFDISQIRELQKKKMLQVTPLKRAVDITSEGGSTGSA